MNFKAAQPSNLEHFTLAIFTCAALAAFAFSQKEPLALILLLPCGVARFWNIPSLPAYVVRWTKYAAWTVLGGTVLVGLIHRAYPILSEESVKRPLIFAGFALAFFAALFLLGSRVWHPAQTLFPVTFGIFLIAAVNPQAPQLHLMLAVAGAAAYLYLAAQAGHSQTGSASAPAARGHLARLAVSGGLIFIIAWGIIQVLPWLQLRIVQSTNRLVTPQTDYYAGLSADSKLGDLEELQLSQKVVMRIWTSHPQKLRGRVFTLFDGQAWHATGKAGKSLMPAAQDFPAAPPQRDETPGAAGLAGWLSSMPGNTFILPRSDGAIAASQPVVRTRIIQTVYNGGMLAMPGNKLTVRVAAPYLHEDVFENLSQPPLAPAEIYGVVNLPQGNLAQQGSGDDGILKGCLALPPNTDSRLKDLAERLKAGANSPAERIQKTLNYLQSQCQYSLKVGRFHTTQPVAEFLFEKRRGYCEYFASSAAVLLRLQGIPSRYVTGFNLQDGNREGSHYVVREADAHAWIEAYLPSEGWVEIDPTPESEYAALHAHRHDGWLQASLERLATIYAEIAARWDQGGWLSGLQWIWGQIKVLAIAVLVGWRSRSLVLLAFMLALIIFLGRRKKIPGRARAGQLAPQEFPAVPSDLRDLMRRLDKTWSIAGYSRPVYRAPLEHWTGIPAEKLSPALRESSRLIIDYYYRTSFGGRPHSATEVLELGHRLDGAERPEPV